MLQGCLLPAASDASWLLCAKGSCRSSADGGNIKVVGVELVKDLSEGALQAPSARRSPPYAFTVHELGKSHQRPKCPVHRKTAKHRTIETPQNTERQNKHSFLRPRSQHPSCLDLWCPPSESRWPRTRTLGRSPMCTRHPGSTRFFERRSRLRRLRRHFRAAAGYTPPAL